MSKDISHNRFRLAIISASANGPDQLVRSTIDPFPSLVAVYPITKDEEGPIFDLNRAIARVDLAHGVAVITDDLRGEELTTELAKAGFDVRRTALEEAS